MSKLDKLVNEVREEVGELQAAAREKAAEALLQYGFLRANWGKVSSIVVTGLLAGFLLGVWVG